MRSFVTATMIAQRLCSPSRDGQELLPQLVAKLITSSIPKEAIRAFRFPAGDQIYLPGEDGILAVDDAIADLHVPAGISVWEMGTTVEPKTKADDDFAKAERKLANAFPDAVPPVTPDKATFVFVTAKPWESGGWVREKRANSTWRSIRVIDAVDLEKWIEQYSTVMLWFADVCGLPAEGLYDAEQYIRKFGIGFGISPLSPDLVIAGRDEELDRLSALIMEGRTETHIHAESIEEAAAFLAAASLKNADIYNSKAPLMFADSRADLNLLATCGADLILVPLDSETLKRRKMFQNNAWQMIVPEMESTTSSGDINGHLTLGRCKRPAIEGQLTEGMRFDEHRASQIARECRGSLIALLWLVGSGSMGAPQWATQVDSTAHASLMLAGSWTGNNEDDIRIIEQISRKDYRDVEALVQRSPVPEGPWMHRGIEWTCVSRDFVWRTLAGKVTETMLDDFRHIVSDVLGEKDPSLELKLSERHMAAIRGKVRKYSSSLRQGLADSVARLATFKSGGQGWADRIIGDLLNPKDTDPVDRWLSLTDVYAELAEASPDMFLDSLDDMLRTGRASQFFQQSEKHDLILGSTSAHVYLLWALERLVWLRQYFSRVLSILARLAEVEPGCRTCNTPQNSLITILLPWRPQHAVAMNDAAQAMKMLYSACPAVTWDVAIALLPNSHASTMATPRPRYREHSAEQTLTWRDYWEFMRTIVESMIEWAGSNVDRWASFIEKYPELRHGYPEAGELITDALSLVDTKNLPNEQKAVVHETLRTLISRHRQHLDTPWALPMADLDLLETIQEHFKPEDTVLQYAHLFSWDPEIADAPMKPYEDGWDEWLSERQAKAAKAVYDQQGVEGLYRLADKAHVPESVGGACSSLPLQEAEVTSLLQNGLSPAPADHARTPLMRAAKAYIWAQYRRQGDPWLSGVLAQPSITWTPNAHANLALALPATPELWRQIPQWSEQADRLYWENVEIHGKLRQHWAEVLEKWKIVGRPWSALELLATVIDERRSASISPKPSVEQVIDVLEQALKANGTTESHRREGAMLSHHVENIFLFLDAQKRLSQQ